MPKVSRSPKPNNLTWVELVRVLDRLVDGLIKKTVPCPPTVCGLTLRTSTLSEVMEQPGLVRVQYHHKYHIAKTVVAEWLYAQPAP